MITIIGGGPCGYVAAIRGAQLGTEKIRLIEGENIGGVCTNWGCIPTKSYAHIAKEYNSVKNTNIIDIENEKVTLNWKKIKARKKKTVRKLRKGIEYLLKKSNIELIRGKAKFKSNDSIEVTDDKGNTRTLRSDKTLIATGSVPQFPPLKGVNKGELWTSKEALDANKIPDSLLVIGGGVIGVEMAHIFSSFGSQVTIVEILPDILPGVPQDITNTLKKELKREGIKILTETEVKRISANNASFRINLEGEAIEVTKVLMAAGRKGKDKVNASEIGVEFGERDFIKVDNKLRTSVDNIYAAGDIVGEPLLAHKASYEGEVAIANILGDDKEITNSKSIPAAIFSALEIGIVGYSEDEAREEELSFEVGKFPYRASGKALADQATNGFVKSIVDSSSKKILGMSFIGEEASDLLGIGSTIVSNDLAVEDIENTIYAHPTLPEMVKEAILNALNKAIHV